jgi:hypothetical protein
MFSHRSDLNYLLDILGGRSLHWSLISLVVATTRSITPVNIGLLGADLEIANNRFRIIENLQRGKLEPGSQGSLKYARRDVDEGDYISVLMALILQLTSTL